MQCQLYGHSRLHIVHDDGTMQPSTYDDAPENGPRMYAMKLNWRTRCMMIGTWCADKQNDAMNISMARMQSNCVDSTPHLTEAQHSMHIATLHSKSGG